MSCVSGPNYIVEEGMLLYLDASNARSYSGSGTTWYDLSGYNRHATLQNSLPFSSVNSGCFDFTAASAHCVTIPHDDDISAQVFDNSSNFTFIVWAAFDFVQNYGVLVQKSNGGNWSNTTNGIWVYTSGVRCVSGCSISGNPSGGYTVVTYPIANLNATRWYQYAFTGDGTKGSMYVNGNLYLYYNFSNLTLTREANTSQIIIGGAQDSRDTTSTNGYDGKVAGLSIYNRGLTASEILQNYNATKSRFIL